MRMLRRTATAYRTLGSGTNSTIVGKTAVLLERGVQFLLMLRSREPHSFVGQNLVGGKTHSRNDVRDIREKWMGENGHEADLSIGQLQHISQFWRTAEKCCLHSHGSLHFSLMGEFLLKQVCPFLGHSPWSCLRP